MNRSSTSLVLAFAFFGISHHGFANPNVLQERMNLRDAAYGRTVNGEEIDRTALHGKVVVIGTWDVSNPDHTKIISALNLLHSQFSSQGVAVLGVELRSPNVDPLESTRKYSIPFPVLGEFRTSTRMSSNDAENLRARGPISISTKANGESVCYSGCSLGFAAVFGQDGALDKYEVATSGLITSAVKRLLGAPKASGDIPVIIPERAWTDNKGRTLRAAVINFSETGVTFKQSTGQIVDVEQAKLSPRDQMFLREQLPQLLTTGLLTNSTDPSAKQLVWNGVLHGDSASLDLVRGKPVLAVIHMVPTSVWNSSVNRDPSQRPERVSKSNQARQRETMRVVDRWGRLYGDQGLQIAFIADWSEFTPKGATAEDMERFLKFYDVDYPIFNAELTNKGDGLSVWDIAVVKPDGEWTYIGNPHAKEADQAVKALMGDN